MGLAKAYPCPNIGLSSLGLHTLAQGIVGLPASHLMAFM